MKLTQATVNGLPLKDDKAKSDIIYFDEDVPGFGLRFRGEARTWVFQYSIGTTEHRITRRMKIGKFTALSPAKARDQAENLHATVQLGGDPAADKRKSRIEATNTFGRMAREYLDFKEGQIRPRSYAEVKRHIEENAKSLHGLSLGSIDQRVIAQCLNAVAKSSGDVTANRTRASLSAMFGWAMGEGKALSNPVMNTNKREENSRDRVLTDAELRIIWNALEDDHYGAIIKLLMLTGQRANEIAGLRWPEIDFEHDLILLPGERTKNGRAHQVPMSATVRSILENQPRAEGRDLVFGYGAGPFSGWSKSKEALDERIEEGAGKAMLHWTPHDLRRTTATTMADKLGIQPHVIEAVLNHVSGHKGGVAGIYNKAVYAAEKRQALDLWADHVAAVLADRKSNVTPLRRA
jgi:integrase